MRDVFNNAAVVFEQRPSVFRDSNPGHPLVQLLLGLRAEVPDVLRVLGLNLWMLDGEAMLGRGFELGLPLDAVVNLESVKKCS